MNLNETTAVVDIPSVDINDYILAKSPEPDKYIQDSPYQVLFQNNSDFIISRKKGRVEKELVILVSENLFYFKENDNVEKVTFELLKIFLKDLRRSHISLEQVLWLPSLNRDNINHLINIITNPTFLAMARENVLTKNSYEHWCCEYWEKNAQLFKETHIVTKDMNSYNYRNCFDATYEIENQFGCDEALYFVEMLKKSNFEHFTCDYVRYTYSSDENKLKGFFQLLNEPYNLELRRLIDYTFIDSYTQGITRISADFWQAYEKYLQMQIQVFGEIRNKYPRYLMLSRDIATSNIGLLKHKMSNEDFAELTAEVHSLAYGDKKYSIITPATTQQIVEEGFTLNHCIGSHAKQIATGDMHILFLRNSKAKDEPLVTLQFSNERITMAEGLNRRALTPDERSFLEKWGKEKDIQISA